MGTREKRGLSIWLVEKSSGGLWRGMESKRNGKTRARRLERTLKALGEAISHRVARKRKKCAFVSPFLIDKETRLIQKT